MDRDDEHGNHMFVSLLMRCLVNRSVVSIGLVPRLLHNIKVCADVMFHAGCIVCADVLACCGVLFYL